MSDSSNKLQTSKILSLPSSISSIDVGGLFIRGYKQVASTKLFYYMWLSRFFIFTAVLSLLLLVSSSLVIFNLAPKVSVEPSLIIRQDSSSSVVRSEPIVHDMPSKSMLMEIFVKQYVMLRNTIIDDQREQETRWFPGGLVHFMSSPNVFDSFNEHRESIWQLITEQKLSREVEIVSVTKAGGDKSPVWKVDFRTYDIMGSRRDPETRAIVVNKIDWTASITGYFVPQRAFMGRRLLNPLGFTVVRYSQTEVEV